MGGGGEPAGRPRAGHLERGGPVRGTSGLRRAGCWVTPSRGDPQESATESRPPMAGEPAQARVKRCGKSAPAPGATRAARQTPPGARPDRGRTARPQTPPGRPLEPAGNRRPRGMAASGASRSPERRRLRQNPAYRPARHHLPTRGNGISSLCASMGFQIHRAAPSPGSRGRSSSPAPRSLGCWLMLR
jgi:hypothetical protein